jgi:hypothetical protein
VSKFDERQMATASEMRHEEAQVRRVSRPHFKAWSVARRGSALIDLVGSATVQGLMRTVLVVPEGSNTEVC